MAGQAQQKVQEKAQDVRGEVSSRVRDQVDTRSTQAGEQVTSMADALRRTGQTLAGGNETPAKVTDTVAERADRSGAISGVGRRRDPAGCREPRETAAVARRRRGLALGLVASRFLKASSGGRYRSQWDLGSRRGYVSPADSEPEVVLEPDVELDSPVGARHGT